MTRPQPPSDAPPPGGGRGPWRWAWLAVVALFLLAGLLGLDDLGTTWDERESYLAGLGNLEILATVSAGGTGVDWPWHELRGYQFVLDTARAAFAVAVTGFPESPLGRPRPELTPELLWGFHLFNLLLATAALVLVHRTARLLGGSRRLALLSVLALATMPKYLAHAAVNPKDLLGLFVFVLVVWAAAETCRRAAERWPAHRRAGSGDRPGGSGATLGRRADAGDAGTSSRRRNAASGDARAAELSAFAGFGVVLGLALTTHVISVVAVAVAAFVVARRTGWWRGEWRRLLGRAALTVAVAAPTAFLTWPWLWADPVVRLARAVRRVLFFPVGMDVLYLGHLYPDAAPPVHYFVVSFAVATPLLLLLAAGVGAGAALRPLRSADPGRERARGRREVALTGLVWTLLLVAFEATTSSRYDGVRHLLAVLPGVALLAGAGLDLALDALARLARPGRAAAGATWKSAAVWTSAALVVGAWLWVPVDLARLHPYYDAYLNAPTRAALAFVDRPPEEIFELEYWGATFREGAEWLNRHAEPGSRVRVPVAPWCAAPYLDPDLVLVSEMDPPGSLPDRAVPPSRAGGPPDYLMIMTRQGFLTDRDREIRHRQEPVFTIRRGRATLLEIYRL